MRLFIKNCLLAEIQTWDVPNMRGSNNHLPFSLYMRLADLIVLRITGNQISTRQRNLPKLALRVTIISTVRSYGSHPEIVWPLRQERQIHFEPTFPAVTETGT